MEHTPHRLVDNNLYIEIHNLQNWEDYDGVDLNSECLAKSSSFFTILRFIDFNLFYTVDRIYLVDVKEVWNFDEFDSNRFSYLGEVLKFFKLLGLDYKVVLLNNNLLQNYTKVAHRPITTFLLGSDIEKISKEELKELRQADKPYRFLFLNRKPKRHRTEIYNFLEGKNLLKDTLYSYNTFIEESNFIHPGFHTELHPTFVQDCLINIVTETTFYQTPYAGDCCYITEKVDKCLSSMMPFIVVGNHSTIRALGWLGFTSYGEIWDESYDDIKDDDERMEAVKNLILEISNWSKEKIEEVKPKLLEIAYNNRLVYEKLHNRRKELTDIQFSSDDFYNFVLFDELVEKSKLPD